jgi:endo-1,4-beta-xylanase
MSETSMPRGRAARLQALVMAGLLAGGLWAGAGAAPAASAAGPTLGSVLAGTGRSAGVAVRAAQLTDPVYATIARQEFTSVTPEVELEFDVTEPAQNQFSFTAGDRVVGWAAGNGQRVRGHLLGSSAMPGWLVNLPPAGVRAAMLNHVTRVIQHQRGKVGTWDVAYEAFADAGGARRNNLWQRTGNDWIEAAFRAARTADPTARLCYNDYGIESVAAVKTQAVLALVRDFRARGVPIDCVGLESHFASTSVPADLPATLASFAALGVTVELTQLDVTGSGSAQVNAYLRVFTACLSVPRCTGVTVWGVRDKDSWRSSDTPLLFDNNGARKPAYQALLSGLLPRG